MEPTKFFRPNILALKPYSCARDEWQGGDAIFLDANESPWDNGVNRYPDPHQRALKQRIGELLKTKEERIILGNGSDEIIDLLIRSTCRPGRDNIVVFMPGYSMYEVCAAINDVQVRRLALIPDYQPCEEALARAVDENTKLIFVCTPNNPTGNIVPLATIEAMAGSHPKTMVVVDEAYIDFADAPSAVTLPRENIFVLQTLSKAWGGASLRVGAGIGHPEVIKVLGNVKAPYNIGGPSQTAALELLRDEEGFRTRMASIRSERERMFAALSGSGLFKKVYPSQANFLLALAAGDAREVYDQLAGSGIVVRLRDLPPLIDGGLRISVGTPEENDKLIALMTR